VTSTRSIVVVGSLNADLVTRVERFPAPGETIRGRTFTVYPGGKGGNQACAAARLGGAVAIIGQVGADGHGEWLRSQLESAGVDVGRVRVDPGVSSGVAVITTDAHAENSIVVVAGANGTFTPARLEESRDAIRGAHVLLLQLEIPLETVLAAARLAGATGAQIVLDPAPATPLPRELLGLTSLVTPNETELAALAGHQGNPAQLADGDLDRLARALIDRGAPAVIVKRAARAWSPRTRRAISPHLPCVRSTRRPRATRSTARWRWR
jgi:ribokinase